MPVCFGTIILMELTGRVSLDKNSLILMVLDKASNYFGQCKAEGNGRALVSLKYALGTAQAPRGTLSVHDV